MSTGGGRAPAPKRGSPSRLRGFPAGRRAAPPINGGSPTRRPARRSAPRSNAADARLGQPPSRRRSAAVSGSCTNSLTTADASRYATSARVSAQISKATRQPAPAGEGRDRFQVQQVSPYGAGAPLSDHLIDHVATLQRDDPRNRSAALGHLDSFTRDHAANECARVLPELTDSRSDHVLHGSTHDATEGAIKATRRDCQAYHGTKGG